MKKTTTEKEVIQRVQKWIDEAIDCAPNDPDELVKELFSSEAECLTIVHRLMAFGHALRKSEKVHKLTLNSIRDVIHALATWRACFRDYGIPNRKP